MVKWMDYLPEAWLRKKDTMRGSTPEIDGRG